MFHPTAPDLCTSLVGARIVRRQHRLVRYQRAHGWVLGERHAGEGATATLLFTDHPQVPERDKRKPIAFTFTAPEDMRHLATMLGQLADRLEAARQAEQGG